MTQIRNKFVDFNSVLMGLNFVVAYLVISRFAQAQGSDYMDQETIMLGVLLSVQTHIALQMERKRRDPFVILLSFTTICYFSLRLYTLASVPVLGGIPSYSYGPKDSNYALIFIIIANSFLYAGLFFVRFNKNKVIDPEIGGRTRRRESSADGISLVYSYFSGVYWTPEDLPRIVGFRGHLRIAADHPIDGFVILHSI